MGLQPPSIEGLPKRFLLSADHYTHPRWQAVEQRAIFQRAWLYAGDRRRLAPETVWTQTLAGLPLVISCDRNSNLRAFYNVCPHRAAQISPQPGIQSCRRLVCPYHAWVYDLTGQLVGVSAEQQFPAPLQKQAWPLRPLRIATWSDFMFVCADDSAPPLADYLGSITTHLGQHRTPGSQLLVDKQYPVACNWKNYHDNTLCDYHVAIAHRTTLHRIQGPVRHYQHQLETYGNLLYTPTPTGWEANNTVLPHLSDRARQGFFTYGLYPHLHLLGLPNGVLAWLRIDPQGVDHCQVRLEIYGDPDYSPPPEQLLADFEAFMQEDMILTESVQRGYASGGYVPGPVSGLEARIIHQQQLIHRALTSAV